MNPGITTEDLGNNESRSTGMTLTNAGWMVLTSTESKTLRTEKGALARRDYNPDGTKIKPAPEAT